MKLDSVSVDLSSVQQTQRTMGSIVDAEQDCRNMERAFVVTTAVFVLGYCAFNAFYVARIKRYFRDMKLN